MLLNTTEQNGRFIAYTHGPQAELDNYLGMALSMDAADHLGHGELAPDAQPVSSTYYVRMPLENGKPVSYNFTAGWAPGHPKLTRYGAALSRRAFATLTSSR